MKTILLLLFIFAAGFIKAQNPLLRKDVILKSGFGIAENAIPFYFGVDYGLTNEMSLGGEFSNNIYRSSVNRAVKAKWSYHFKKVLGIREVWDIFAGVGLGYYMYEEGSENHSGADLSAHVGISYFLSYKFGLNLEVGAGNAFKGPKIGVALKL